MISKEHGIASLYHAYRDSTWALKHTSRASNPVWYHKASDLPLQWHLSVDGNTLTSAVWEKTNQSWSDGPELGIDQLQSPPNGFAEEVGGKILARVRKKEQRGLGVVIHLHDSLQLAEIRSEFTGTGENFLELNEFVQIAPDQALSGVQVDQNVYSYSVLPYWGASATGRNAIALQTQIKFRAFVEQIVLWGEKHNIPVKVAVTAAPLEALARLNLPPRNPAHDSPRDGRILVFRSEVTSFVAILNHEDELCSARILVNQGAEKLPLNLAQVLRNCAAAEDIQNPSIDLVDMAGAKFAVPEEKLLAMGIRKMEAETSNSLPLEFSNPTNSPVQNIADEELRPIKNRTFAELTDHWADRNLYSLECLDESRYPTQTALQFLKVSRLVRLLMVLAIPVIVTCCAMNALRAAQQDYWKVSKSDVMASSAKVEKLTLEKKRILYWENLMASRSEGWIPLTAILELLPEEQGIILTDFEFNFRSLPPEKRAKNLPMRQTWRLKGQATVPGMHHLVSMSSKSNISGSFDRIAEWSASPVYSTSESTRSLRVLLDQKQETGPSSHVIPSSKAIHYRNGFEIEIERNFTEKDGIALVIKTPSTGQPLEN